MEFFKRKEKRKFSLDRDKVRNDLPLLKYTDWIVIVISSLIILGGIVLLIEILT